MPTAVDESSVRDIPGMRVVHDNGFLGIAADCEWDAVQAAERLKITWSEPAPPFPENAALYRHIGQARVARPAHAGAAEAAICVGLSCLFL